MTKPTVSKHRRKPAGLSDKAWIPPAPCYNNTNSVAFGTDYVKVVEDTPILSAAEM